MSIKKGRSRINIGSALNAIALAEERGFDEVEQVFATNRTVKSDASEISDREWFNLYLRQLGYLPDRMLAALDELPFYSLLDHRRKAIIEFENGEFAFFRAGAVYSNQGERVSERAVIERIWQENLSNKQEKVMQGCLRTRIVDAEEKVVVPEVIGNDSEEGVDNCDDGVSLEASWLDKSDKMIRYPQALGAYAFYCGGFGNVWQIDDEGDYTFEAVFETEITELGCWLPVCQDKLKCSPIPVDELASRPSIRSSSTPQISQRLRQGLIGDAAQFLQAIGLNYEQLSKGLFFFNRVGIAYRALDGQITHVSSRRPDEIGIEKGRGFQNVERAVATARLRPRRHWNR